MGRSGRIPALKGLLGSVLVLLGLTLRADYSNTVMSFHPAAYWRLNETVVPAADTAINRGTLGAAATGYYTSGATHPVAGALAGSGDTAAAFDGISGEMAVPFQSALAMRPPFTVEAWVQPQQVPPGIDPAAVLACANFAGNGRLGWVIYQTGYNWNLRLGNTNGYTFNQTGTSTVQAGVWHHLVAVYDGTNATLYVNGSVDATGRVSSFTPNNGAPFEIGNVLGSGGTGRYENAVVDEVAVYTNSLSAAAILGHYQNGTNASRSIAYDQLVLAGNPVMYFRLDEPVFTPGSLPVAVNLGSLGASAEGVYQPGSLPGAAGVAYTGLGAANHACRFNGVQAFVDLGANPGLDLQGPMTLIAWVKGNPADSRFQCMLGNGDQSWRMEMNTNGSPDFGVGQANRAVRGTFNVNDGKWHHLAGVYDGNTLQLFVDGVSDGMIAAPFPIEGGVTFAAIGRAPDFVNRFFAGSVDEAAIFTNALTSGQIRHIFESANVPPSITLPPVPQSVSEGMSVSLNVAAIGTPALSYQWTWNGTLLSGQTAAVLVLTNISPIQSGNYAVEVANAFGLVVSAPVRVAVQPAAPVLVQPPQGLARYAGGTATFLIGATGYALSYQWAFEGTPISGATAASYTLTNVQSTNVGGYTCTVSNAGGSETSAAAALTLVAAPGDSYSMAVLADGPIAFWRLDETNGPAAHDFQGGHDGQYTNAALGQPGYSLLVPDTSAAFGPARDSCVKNIPGIDFGTSAANAAFSIEAWVKCPFGQNGDVGIVAKGTGGAEQFSLDLGNGGGYRFLVRDSSGDGKSAGSAVSPNNNWQHIVGVCDEPHGQLRIYVNGDAGQNDTLSAGVWQSSNPASIGSRQSGGPAYDLNLNGLVDEVAIYGYALSQSQVRTHFNARYGANSAPVIGAPPAAATNYASLRTTFTVDAAGTPPVFYQWQFNGSNISGATNSAFAIASLDATNAGSYRVVVSNPFGTNSSGAALLTVLPAPAAVDVSDGLVLHLKFDGDYLDWSCRGNHATNVGATAFITGEIGSQALHYASTGGSSFNYATLGLRPDLQFGSNVNFSVAYWVRYPANDHSGDLPVLGNAVNSACNPGYVFSQAGGGWLWTIYDVVGNGVPAQGATNSINDGNWHQLVQTFDRTNNASTYLDGVPVDSRPIGHPDGSSIGNLDTGHSTNLGQDTTGAYPVTAAVDVDDVGVWHRVLTPLEVSGMYVVGKKHGVSFATVPLQIAVLTLSGQVELIWPAGILQSAGGVAGPYVNLPGVTSPYVLTPSGSQKFYRLFQ